MSRWFGRSNRWKDVSQKQIHRVEIWPPIQTSQEQNVRRLPLLPHRPKEGGVHSVFHHLRASAMEIGRHTLGILIADRDNLIRFSKDSALKTLEFFPLLLDVPALERILLRLIVTLPNHGLQIVSHDQSRATMEMSQGMGIRRPFAVPEVDGLGGCQLRERLLHGGAHVS